MTIRRDDVVASRYHLGASIQDEEELRLPADHEVERVDVVHQGIVDSGVDSLSKPFSAATLLARVRALLAG